MPGTSRHVTYTKFLTDPDDHHVGPFAFPSLRRIASWATDAGDCVVGGSLGAGETAYLGYGAVGGFAVGCAGAIGSEHTFGFNFIQDPQG